MTKREEIQANLAANLGYQDQRKNFKLKTHSDSVRELVLDYFALLNLDKNGLLNEDFTIKDFTGIVDAVEYACKRENDREFKALVHLLSNRLSEKL